MWLVVQIAPRTRWCHQMSSGPLHVGLLSAIGSECVFWSLFHFRNVTTVFIYVAASHYRFLSFSCRFSLLFPCLSTLTPAHADAQILTGEWQKPTIEINTKPRILNHFAAISCPSSVVWNGFIIPQMCSTGFKIIHYYCLITILFPCTSEGIDYDGSSDYLYNDWLAKNTLSQIGAAHRPPKIRRTLWIELKITQPKCIEHSDATSNIKCREE
mgnify:CR=1 FL=1